MAELLWASASLLVLLAGSAAGLLLRGRLREHHRSKDSVESVRMIVSMVVTFSALVLGLLVTSVKADFDDHTELYKRYGISLIELDQRLREYGPDAQPIRTLLRSYTAAIFVLNWPREPVPAGDYPVNLHPVTAGSDEMEGLTAIVLRASDAINRLAPATALQQEVAATLKADIRQLEILRWTVIQRSSSKLSTVFVAILVSWLLIVFFVFGVVSPRNGLVYVVIFVSAFAVSTSLYLVFDLDTPLGGLISISSRPFRDALWHMDQVP